MDNSKSYSKTGELDISQKRILASKIKSVTDHLQSISQKKIRLELEIKQTRKRLKKLTNQVKKSQKFEKAYREFAENCQKTSFSSPTLFWKEKPEEEQVDLVLFETVFISEQCQELLADLEEMDSEWSTLLL